MPDKTFATLIDKIHETIQPDLNEHEIEDRLLDRLMGKKLNFSTTAENQAVIKFHNIARGKKSPSTMVTLQVEGVEFDQNPERLTLDLRYVFYQQYKNSGLTDKFLITSPFVQELGPENILIKFGIYGNTVFQVNRCLSIFADVVKAHQDDRHQTAIAYYNEQGEEWGSDPDISIDHPITPRDYGVVGILFNKIQDESYIEDYIRYINDHDGNFRETIDNKNTWAESML